MMSTYRYDFFLAYAHTYVHGYATKLCVRVYVRMQIPRSRDEIYFNLKTIFEQKHQINCTYQAGKQESKFSARELSIQWTS